MMWMGIITTQSPCIHLLFTVHGRNSFNYFMLKMHKTLGAKNWKIKSKLDWIDVNVWRTNFKSQKQPPGPSTNAGRKQNHHRLQATDAIFVAYIWMCATEVEKTIDGSSHGRRGRRCSCHLWFCVGNNQALVIAVKRSDRSQFHELASRQPSESSCSAILARCQELLAITGLNPKPCFPIPLMAFLCYNLTWPKVRAKSYVLSCNNTFAEWK